MFNALFHQQTRTPDYDYLQSKAKQVAYDFSLTNAILPVDRDGDRRWASMVMKRRAAEAEGKEFPDAAVVTGEYLWANLRLAEKAYSLESLRIFAWVYI